MVLPPLLVVYVLALLVQVARGPRYSVLQYAVVTVFVIYLLVVIHSVVLPIYITTVDFERALTRFPRWNFNLVPFARLYVRDFVLNVALFVPLGLLLPLLLVRFDSLRRMAFFGFRVAVIIEGLQLLLTMFFGSGRSVDINDMIANTLGVVVGYALFRLGLRIDPIRVLFERARLPIG